MCFGASHGYQLLVISVYSDAAQEVQVGMRARLLCLTFRGKSFDISREFTSLSSGFKYISTVDCTGSLIVLTLKMLV